MSVQAARVLDVALADGGLVGLTGGAIAGHMLWPAAGVMISIDSLGVLLSRSEALAFADRIRAAALDA